MDWGSWLTETGHAVRRGGIPSAASPPANAGRSYNNLGLALVELLAFH